MNCTNLMKPLSMKPILLIAALAMSLAATAQSGSAPGSAPSLANPLGGTGASEKPSAGSTASKAAAAGTYREIKWDDLVPKDWDPLKQFKDINFSLMSDSDPRAAEMLKKMRETWDNAPTNNEIDGASVRIPGYLVPLAETKSGMKEFLLVPYFGACIHTPPPPANQIIHVTPLKPPKGFHSMDTVWISGTLKALRTDSYMGSSGYRMEATAVEPYTEKR